MRLKTRTRKPRKVVRIKNADMKHLGEEPVVVNNRLDYMTALNWYNYFYELKVARKFLDEYVKTNKLSLKNTKEINLTMCAIARMLNNGLNLPSEAKEYLHRKINERRIPEPVVEKVANTSSAMLQRGSIIADFEDVLDEFYRGEYKFFEPQVYDKLREMEAKPIDGKAVVDYYTPLMEELVDHAKEYKARIGQRKYSSYLQFVGAMISDAERFVSNKRIAKPRKPRRKRAVNPDKAVAKVKYQKEDNQLKLVSIPPSSIINAEEVWLYNTKYRKLIQVVAKEGEKLGVKGSGILNYDEEKSSSKKLRKPEDVVTKFLDATKFAKRIMFNSIKTTARAYNGRINEQTLILKAN